MSLANDYPQQYKEWVDAGGIESNFRDHLVGIGMLPPSFAAVLNLAGNMQAKAQEMRNAASALQVGPLDGVDVSDFQGQVDWSAVKADGQCFAFCKATEGVGFTASTFARNWGLLKQALVRRGAYHFARPDQTAPIDEANYFLGVVGPTDAGDMLALDIETGDGDLSAWCLAWLEHVSYQRPNADVFMYSGLWFMQPHNLLVPALARYKLWIAAYQDTVPDPPSPWTKVSCWQRSASGRVNGIIGDVDLDVLFE